MQEPQTSATMVASSNVVGSARAAAFFNSPIIRAPIKLRYIPAY